MQDMRVFSYCTGLSFKSKYALIIFYPFYIRLNVTHYDIMLRIIETKGLSLFLTKWKSTLNMLNNKAVKNTFVLMKSLQSCYNGYQGTKRNMHDQSLNTVSLTSGGFLSRISIIMIIKSGCICWLSVIVYCCISNAYFAVLCFMISSVNDSHLRYV